MKIWADRWTGQSTCRQTRLMIPCPTLIVTDYIMTLNREDCSLLVQFLTGHNYLRYHLYTTGISDSKECRLCQDGIEDSWHLLTKCETLFRLRYEIFLELDITKLPHPRGVLQFIKATRVYNLLRPPEADDDYGLVELLEETMGHSPRSHGPLTKRRLSGRVAWG